MSVYLSSSGKEEMVMKWLIIPVKHGKKDLLNIFEFRLLQRMNSSVDVTVLNKIKFFLSFIWDRMLTMFWLVFVPIKYFSQREFLCNSFCWFNFQFRSDGDRVYFHSARNNFIKYHWIVFTKHHFVTTYTPLSEKKEGLLFSRTFYIH